MTSKMILATRLSCFALATGLSWGCDSEEDPLDDLVALDGGIADSGSADLGATPDTGPVPDAGVEMPSPTALALEAAERNRGRWTWIPVEGARCRDGSDTGFLLRLQPDARELMVFFQGGGACFNEATCRANPAAFSESQASAQASALGRGIFNPDNADNPVANWNVAFIPYCTGDVFMGSSESVTVDGLGAQDFVGALNVEAFSTLLADRYESATDHVLVTGSSAGGFGAAVSFPVVADRFPSAQVDLLDDSGQLLPFGDAIAPCLLQLWFDLWGESLTALCPECSATQDGLFGWARYLAETYPASRLALASYTEDIVIRGFFRFGEDGCNPQSILPISGGAFSSALLDFRRDLPSWGTYYVGGVTHTFLSAAATYERPLVDSTTLAGFLGQLLAGEVRDVGP